MTTHTLNTPTIIGLAGPAGSGKDTVADLLRTPVRFNKCAFADQLRWEVCEAYKIEPLLLTHRPTKEDPHPALALKNCTDHAFTGMLLKSGLYDRFNGSIDDFLDAPRSPRHIMQLWGTEYRRAHDHGYWTSAVVSHIAQQCRSHNHRHVITDVRFENEAQAVRNMGGVIWQIKRPGLTLDTTHSSESDGSQFAPDAIINNSHDIRHLQAVVMSAWTMLETGLSAQEIFDMGNAHMQMACDQWGTRGKAAGAVA